MSAEILSDYLAESELAKELGLCTRTIQRWRAKREGPPVTLIGQSHVYRIDSVRDWLKANEQPVPRKRTRKLRTASALDAR